MVERLANTAALKAARRMATVEKRGCEWVTSQGQTTAWLWTAEPLQTSQKAFHRSATPFPDTVISLIFKQFCLQGEASLY